MAISIITAVVFAMYLMLTPNKSPEKVAFAGTNYVQISSATWGLNCNPHVKHAILEAEAARAAMPRAERDKVEMPKIVTRNNALSHMSTLCNGKEICSFLVEADIIGFDPIYSCFKELELNYRCYEIDRLRHATLRQGEFAKLDCSKTAIGNK
jgi:hypothetical protein